jgi:SAM-dependent methyltransferase
MSYQTQVTVPPKATLGQRARADMQALGSIQVAAYRQLRQAARTAFYADPQGQALAQESATGGRDASSVRRRVDRATALAQTNPIFKLERFLQRYVAEENWARAIVAVEEKRDAFADFLQPPGLPHTGSLDLDPDLRLPKFFKDIEFHLQPGGWEGYDLYGPALSFAIYPHVFSRGGFASMPATAAATGYRNRIIGMLPKSDYARIFDVGCGSGSTTRWLRQHFPNAELVACDLSAVQLKAGFALAERARASIHFKQRDGRATGEPSDSFDLVTHNALAHEMPPKANVEVFREMFRILKPGGDLMVMDPPPFRDVDPFQGAILNWETDHRDEPFLTSALLSDWEKALRDIGFVEIRAQVLDDVFPWLLIATKPAVSAK